MPPSARDPVERRLIAEAVEMANDAAEVSAELAELAQAAVAVRAQVLARLIEVVGSQAEAARLLGIDRTTINKLVNRGRLLEGVAPSISLLRERAVEMAAAFADLEKRLTEAAGAQPDFAEPPALTGRSPEPDPTPT